MPIGRRGSRVSPLLQNCPGRQGSSSEALPDQKADNRRKNDYPRPPSRSDEASMLPQARFCTTKTQSGSRFGDPRATGFSLRQLLLICHRIPWSICRAHSHRAGLICLAAQSGFVLTPSRTPPRRAAPSARHNAARSASCRSAGRRRCRKARSSRDARSRRRARYCPPC